MLDAVFEEDGPHSTVFYTKILHDRVDEILEDSGVDFLDELLIVDVPVVPLDQERWFAWRITSIRFCLALSTMALAAKEELVRIRDIRVQCLQDKAEIISQMKRSPLMVIDDLCAERQSEYAQEIVYYVVDNRYKTGKPLIVTTNLTLNEMNDPKNMDYLRI